METVALEAEVDLVNGAGDRPPASLAGIAPALWEQNGHAEHAEDPTAASEADVARLAGIVESLLFASGAPVPLARLIEALDGPDRREVTAALRLLGERYEQEGHGLRLAHVAGGYQLRTPSEHGPWVRRLLGQKPPRLSRPMLETLAIVAYRQPCTKVEIEAVRGVDADAVLTTLMERRLIRIAGRKETPGRPLLYVTSREFLEVFGLPDLQALPPLKELGCGAELLAARDLTIGPEGIVPTDPEAAVVDAEPPPDASAEGDES